MASYKGQSGAVLQPGNQINRLSGYNDEGVFGLPGVEAFEIVGYVKVSNVAADKASYKSFNITVPSPDRRSGDRVRDDRTSLVVQASAARPAYVYGASIAIGQDVPTLAADRAGFPAAPVTAAPALQSSKNISPNTHPAATFLANLSPSGVRYFV